MNIIGIESVIYGVDDLERCARFWDDFGLQRRDAGENRVTFAAADGGTVVVRRIDDPALPAAPIDGPTVREVIWGADSPETLDAVASELAKDREVSRGDDGTVHAVDPQGYAIGFRLSSLEPLSAEPTAYNQPGAAARIDRPGVVYQQAAPRHLAHVVFRSPKLDEMLDFYVGRLGFRQTDSYPGRGYFLRAGASDEHHNLFVFNPDDSVGFHHVAFNVRDIHEVFGGGLHMTSQGWETHLGPGRHPISSAYFWYFRNPAGGAAEYDFDSDICTENWQPREFQPTPEAFAEWSLDDGIERYRGIQSARS